MEVFHDARLCNVYWSAITVVSSDNYEIMVNAKTQCNSSSSRGESSNQWTHSVTQLKSLNLLANISQCDELLVIPDQERLYQQNLWVCWIEEICILVPFIFFPSICFNVHFQFMKEKKNRKFEKSQKERKEADFVSKMTGELTVSQYAQCQIFTWKQETRANLHFLLLIYWKFVSNVLLNVDGNSANILL